MPSPTRRSERSRSCLRSGPNRWCSCTCSPVVDRTTPVLFVDTDMLFRETLDYQLEVAWKLQPDGGSTASAPNAPTSSRGDPEGLLHQYDANACCNLRKTRPLARALAPFDAWITGRKRFQGGAARLRSDFFERPTARRASKVNPLAHWTRGGYRGLHGQQPPAAPPRCSGKATARSAARPAQPPTLPGEDPRAGRWRGKTKDECGMHFTGGSALRTGKRNPDDARLRTRASRPTTGRMGSHRLAGRLAAGGAAPRPVDVPVPTPTRPPPCPDGSPGISLIRIGTVPSFGGRARASPSRRRPEADGLLSSGGCAPKKATSYADQYAMARRAGFDEVEGSARTSPPARPGDQWLAGGRRTGGRH